MYHSQNSLIFSVKNGNVPQDLEFKVDGTRQSVFKIPGIGHKKLNMTFIKRDTGSVTMMSSPT